VFVHVDDIRPPPPPPPKPDARLEAAAEAAEAAAAAAEAAEVERFRRSRDGVRASAPFDDDEFERELAPLAPRERIERIEQVGGRFGSFCVCVLPPSAPRRIRDGPRRGGESLGGTPRRE
jgi:hypothetical protein